MKIIHCADLHLDSRMESVLPAEKAKERRMELLHTFIRMIEQAAENEVEAVLICGDLFDGAAVSSRAGNCVRDVISQHPQIMFYYLQGNHDSENFFDDAARLPDNLRTFGSDWTCYEQGDLVITGVRLSGEHPEYMMRELSLDKNRINIVMLHGMITEYGAKNQTEEIPLRELREKNIDYLALGHLHSYRLEQLDERGMWCYCGCLEGRGFDECGRKGYVELEISKGTVVPTFVPFAGREIHEIPVDITGLMTQEEIQKRVRLSVQEYPSKDLVKICLKGEMDPEAETDAVWIQKRLKEDFYFLKVKDETTLGIRPEDYQYDVSLKGEFVRLVLASDMTEKEKQEVLRRGIRALTGKG